ncbi:TetR/AcrR family transcriptional regulator, partial [Streptomyces sp. NPDC093228]
LASQLAETQPDARQDLADGFDRWNDPIRRGLAAMRDRGELRPDANPDQLSLSLLASLQGGTLMTQTMRNPGPLQAALDSAIAYIHTFVPAA